MASEIVFIQVTDHRTTPPDGRQATGFLVSQAGYILTSRSLLGNQADFNSDKLLFEVKRGSSTQSKSAWVVDESASYDLLLLKTTPEASDKAVEFGAPEAVPDDTRVYVSAFRKDGIPIQQVGILKRFDSPVWKFLSDDGQRVLDSEYGGPVYTDKGEVIGIMKAGIDPGGYFTTVDLADRLLVQIRLAEMQRVIYDSPNALTAKVKSFEEELSQLRRIFYWNYKFDSAHNRMEITYDKLVRDDPEPTDIKIVIQGSGKDSFDNSKYKTATRQRDIPKDKDTIGPKGTGSFYWEGFSETVKSLTDELNPRDILLTFSVKPTLSDVDPIQIPSAPAQTISLDKLMSPQ